MTTTPNVMPSELPPPKPKRRRRGKPRCKRESCFRPLKAGYSTCSVLCSLVVHELDKAERMCKGLGGDTEHWLAAVELNDALTEYWRNDHRVFRAIHHRVTNPA